ncbi:MAG: protein-glutamate O-methyltransferase CheR [Mariprofundaceae bacterium]|nr:protein-glutamate O-methyltransferase CheR [Mariprofundaceae bacterium]
MNNKFTGQDFSFVRRLFYDYSGIMLGEDKAYFAEARLSELVRQEGLASLGALLLLLRKQVAGGSLQLQACELLLIAETSFFRDIHPFEVLKSHVIPALIEKNSHRREINLWCAACASGQEPFSLAMLMDYHFPILRTWKVNITATDISHRVLERAKSGCFNQMEVNRGLPAAMLVRYFSRQGMKWCINDTIRQMVSFEHLNLMDPHFMFKNMDVIFIRNILIYFDLPSKQVVLKKIRQCLHPEGYVFLGSAEGTVYVDQGFTPIYQGKTIYYRLNESTVDS